MAAAQALPLTHHPSNRLGEPRPRPLSSERRRCAMGSVGSLIERPDVSPERPKSWRPPAAPLAGLRKGPAQRELPGYLGAAKKEPRAGKATAAAAAACIKREHGREEEGVFTKVCHRDGEGSLPTPGRIEKSRFRPSAFKPVAPRNFSSVQNLYSPRSEEQENSFSGGPHGPHARGPQSTAPASSSSSSSSPSRQRPRKALPATAATTTPPRALGQDEENLSDSGHNSMSSLPPYRPPFRPHLGPISASMGHINHIGSLDRASAGARGGASAGSMAALGRLPCRGEAPPPYELSRSLEDVVRDLEDRLLEKEHELKQMRRNLDESEDAIAQVFEGKQRLWEKEMEELKRLYSSKMRQVSQQSQRSQRTLQLQVYKAQQEKRRLQEDLEALQKECQSLKARSSGLQQEQDSPRLEETKWEVCQKSGEISLLKQQLRDAQAEVTHKLGEIFQLKTQLREARAELRARDGQMEALRQTLRGARRGDREEKQQQQQQEEEEEARKARFCPLEEEEEEREAGEERPGRGGQGTTEERLRAELLLERRQNEAQASTFEAERQTWQAEKEKVICYQKELQASYLEMYHKNQALERELRELRGGSGGGAAPGADRPLPGLPWIERIESSEI
ncbi:NEDD4-binding protein 3-B [Lepisosteus oculatus]|uniref:NEDD4-binding protein 3-B n=1 Tax=Lepisosteus oculatus TaxID=7918 RepID=UPI0035F52F27